MKKRSPLLIPEVRIFALNGFAVIKRLDSSRRLDHYLYSYIVELALYDPNIHTLRRACTQGNLKLVQFLIEFDEHFLSRAPSGLQSAALNGHLDIVKFMVTKGINFRENSDLALRWASENGHLEVVKYLVENGADVHAVNDCALVWAIRKCQFDVMKYLMDRGCSTRGRR